MTGCWEARFGRPPGALSSRTHGPAGSGHVTKKETRAGLPRPPVTAARAQLPQPRASPESSRALGALSWGPSPSSCGGLLGHVQTRVELGGKTEAGGQAVH